MNLSLERKIAIGLGVAWVVLALVTAAAWWNTARFKSTHYWVGHTREVIDHLEQLSNEILTLHASASGFVLTASDELLAPVDASSNRLTTSLKELQRLLADNPRQQERYRRLEPLAVAARDLMLGQIAARRRQGPDSARETRVHAAGQRAVEQFRTLMREMETEEHRLLDNRLSRVEVFGQLTVYALVGITALAIGLVFITSRIVRRDLQRRREIEHEVAEQRVAAGRIHSLNADLANRAAQLEAANSELESFSYSVSHDLRAPLRHIDGFASLLTRRANETLDAEGRRYVATISQSAKRMGALIDDLVAFSRIGRSPLCIELVRHGALVAEVIANGNHDAGGRLIEWDIAQLPDLHGDATMLRKVWVNLIENAVKYSSKSTVPRITIASRDDLGAGETVFFIRDNGVGFDMAYAEKLFGMFQRLHSPTEFEGRGIGLANVRRIIARHGGRTWAEARVNEGATFYFSLPRNNSASGSSA